jgi:hypothetical protein
MRPDWLPDAPGGKALKRHPETADNDEASREGLPFLQMLFETTAPSGFTVIHTSITEFTNSV